MSDTSKFSFVFKTAHGDGRITERTLAETNSRDRANMLRHRIRDGSDVLTSPRCKKVVVVEVDRERFRVFCPKGKPPAPQDVFESIDLLANALSANPITLRAALSRAYKKKQSKATVRGVTYAYGE